MPKGFFLSIRLWRRVPVNRFPIVREICLECFAFGAMERDALNNLILTKLKKSMKRFLFVLTTLLVTVGLATAQTRAVRGTVTSADDGEPIIGASVVVKNAPGGAVVGVTTDFDGKFKIDVPNSSKTLIVSYMGMKAQEVAITQGELKIVLESDSKMIDEVVVTGYTTTSKKAFTGAASSVGGETVKAKFDANPINALKGNVPGMQMSNISGQPGAPSTVFIRGRNSLNSGTQPLYVIDGVPLESGTMGMRASEGVEISPLATLSADDIASVTVLKDATATSIYGARAANGVIVITTKRGKAGFKMNFSARVGASRLPFYTDAYKAVDASTYLDLAVEGISNGLTYGATSKINSYFNRYKGLHKLDATPEGYKKYVEWWTDLPNVEGAGTNWMKEITRTGMLQNYSIDLSGGGDTPRSPRYFVSLDYLSDKGIIIAKDLTRYSLRANIDQAPYDFFSYGINTSLSMTTTNMGAGGGYFTDPITQSFMQSPMSPVKLEDGSWNLSTINGYNPVAQRSAYGDVNRGTQYRALFSPFVTLKFTDYLSFTSRFGLDAYILDDFGYWSLYGEQGRNMGGMGEQGYFTNFYTSITNTLNFNKTWGDHRLNALIGQEGQRTQYKEAYLSASNYAVDYLNEVGVASVPSSASTFRNELRLLSFLSNFEYNYADRYYASASFRYDASSRFHKNHRWAPFWSIGAKWRAANEEFMKDTQDWLNDLTLRVSYGTSGNQAVGSGWNAGRSLYSFGYGYNNLPGSLFTQFDAPDLKWEQTGKFNVGFDTRLFDRVSFSFDYYNHKTKDMVFAVPISASTGLPSYYSSVAFYENIGSLSNKGVEFSLTVDAIKNADTQLSFSFNGSHNKNKVEKLSGNGAIEGTYSIIEEGRDIYTFYMKEWAGVDPDTGVGTWYKDEEGTEVTKNYNYAAKRFLGSASPVFQGGFKTDFRYKGFDVAMQLGYSLGGKIYGNHLRFDEHTGQRFGNNYVKYVADNRWQKPGDNALVPMLTDSPNTWNSHSSRYLMSGNYLKIQSLMMGYTYQDKSLRNIGLSSIRFYVAADNLYTFTAKNYRGFDPASVGANGVAWWNYPQALKLTAGLTLGF